VLFGPVCKLVSLRQGEGWVGDDIGLEAQRVPDPAHPQIGYAADTIGGFQGVFSEIDDARLDRIHQPAEDFTGRPAQDTEDRDGDQQPDDRIREPPTESDAAGSDQHSEGGESVGAGMQSIGYQGRGADLSSDPDAVASDHLVARETYESGRGNGPEMGDSLGMDEALDRLVGCRETGGGDRDKNRDAGQVLGHLVRRG
jgi:hypothetical protein